MSKKVSKTFTMSEDMINDINNIAESLNTTRVGTLCALIEQFNTDNVHLDKTSSKNVTYSLPIDIVEMLENKAKILGVPIVQVIRLALIQYNMGNNTSNIGLNTSNMGNTQSSNRASDEQRAEFEKLLNNEFWA